MSKIDIISGFLGAGKTTLIKKLLEEALKGEQVVLIENEFGEIGIDGGFLKEAGIQITEMNSGCICCSLVGDFGKALEEVIEKTSEEVQNKVDWTTLWSKKYPILASYRKEVEIDLYASELERLLNDLEKRYGYTNLNSFLVLKDILAQVWQKRKN